MRKQTRRLANAGNSKQNRHERARSGNLAFDHFERNMGFVTLGLLGLLGLVILNPIVVQPAEAICENNTNCAEASKPLALAVVANPTISISMEPSVVIDTLPTSEGTFNKNSTKVRVGTNNTSGLKVMMNGLSGTDLVSTNLQDTTNKVATIAVPSTAANFAQNSWGYYFGQNLADENTTYESIPQDETVIEDLTSPAEMTEYELIFGANVSTSLPAGTYTGEVVISAIANPLAITTMQELIYMQDMTTEICAASGEVTPGGEVTKQLIDSRDGTKYWVAKMADQNCWMTQNLALNLREGQRLTAGDTDLTTKTEWSVLYQDDPDYANKSQDSIHFAKPTTFGKIVTDPASATEDTDSWNLGNYVVIKPEEQSTCEDFANCPRIAELSTVENPDLHYRIGNYYTYNAATAGSLGEMAINGQQQLDAPNSICPKGWTLPSVRRNTDSSSADYGLPINHHSSFYNLFLAYGYQRSDYNQTHDVSYAEVKDGAYQDPIKAPFYFSYTGDVEPKNGKLNYTFYGYYWSRTTLTTLGGMNALITPALYINNGSGFNTGFSVRCLAK